MTATHYTTLGVDPGASREEIQHAWRKLAKQWHPDGFMTRPRSEQLDAEKRYRAAEAAKAVLLDPAARAKYDAPPPEPPAKPDRIVDLPYEVALRGGPLELEVQGRDGRWRRVQLKVPPGVRAGHRWPLADVTVVVRHTQQWVRKNYDLHGKLRVSLADLITGAEVVLDGPHGPVAVELPAQQFKPLRVKGHGHGVAHQSAGDLVLELDVVCPTDRRLIAEIRRATSAVNS